MQIGLLSDTHGHLDDHMLRFLDACDEIWHAGDFGGNAVADRLMALKPLKGVYGNIDGREIRAQFPEDLRFMREGLDVLMTHIGGYPGKYAKRVKTLLEDDPPGLFICGHSHILKIMRDPKLGLLHINPGACGQEGFHLMRTMVRFSIREGTILGLEVIELGRRGRLP
ncbi:MAG: metallophosphoesterase family protein [Haliscomenobacter sp.]|nr:metallophosphoesterase family protein [Haliscomenobacter sp.]